ncbi:hypothetical protein [Roseicella sp. DB1501]|uniref:hypothetical protein n=1 Tax=Roseicella sp. DB1501 TaxID=2730925 RepID=UPI00149263E5|nr:hypothetical protein [Roseicella sp. DB1501]NOG72359.1 hypothetical protein [Roseicella sp. DB1501]
MFRPVAVLVLTLTASLATPAGAQQRVVVAEDAAVAVPARGAARVQRFSYASAPAAATGQRPRYGRLAPREAEAAPSLLPAAAVVVPLAAAAALAAALAGRGGSGGISAPVRTR